MHRYYQLKCSSYPMKFSKILILALLTALSSAAQVGREIYRPSFHYTRGSNWMNDPNGLVHYNGKYHMFYQCNPSGIGPGNVSWGHATSTDLVNWEEKPIAIPVQNGVMAYSGSVVVDWKNTSGFGINGQPPLVALYTGKTSVEDQRVAYSNDEGLTWTNYSQNPVLSLNNNQFRDPKVTWHEETQKWIMVVSQGAWQGIRFYTSPDLKNWTSIQGFGPAENMSGFWECPDFFRLPVDNDSTKMKWVLVHSVSPTAQYFIGDFNSGSFKWENTSPNGLLFDDFENSTHINWTNTGSSFGSIPTSAISGYLGNKLVNSLFNGNAAQGKLISSNFIIQKKYLSFLIGGGDHANGTYIKLVVNGQTVRTSTGNKEYLLRWRNWDVSALAGQTAHIEIVDSSIDHWGHITIDHIIQSDVIKEKINTGQVDYGKDFYAVQSFSDMPDGRRVWLAWMNDWNYAEHVPTYPWKGMMSIPREVKLETHNGQIKLVQKPIEELKILRKDSISFRNAKIKVIDNSLNDNMINNLQSISLFKQFELKAKIAVENKKGFSLKFKKRGSQYSEFIFDFINKEIRFDRSRSGGLTGDSYFTKLQVAPLIIEDGFFDFHLFVDNASAELFASNGQIVMSNQIFPDSTSNKIEFASLGENFIIEELDIWIFVKGNFLPGPSIEKYPLFKVYPNPVVNSNGMAIKIKDQMAGEVIFQLFDVTGKLVSEFQPGSNNYILPRNKMAASNGVFFLKGSYGLFTQTEKIMVLDY